MINNVTEDIVMTISIFMRHVLVTVCACTLLAAMPFQANAYQPDGPHATHAKKNAATWAAEDSEIDARLAALEKSLARSSPNFTPGRHSVH